MLIFEDLKERKMDLEAIVRFLENTIVKLKSREGLRVGKIMYNLHEERIPVADECEKRLKKVIAFIEKYDPMQLQSANIQGYKPRDLSNISEVLRYRTELTKTKYCLTSLSGIIKLTGDKERLLKCEECLNDIRFVYSAFGKIRLK